jgi:capsular polysaccharide biosynthesis protein
MNDQINFLLVLQVFKKRWLWLAVSAVMGFALFAGYSYFMIPKTYNSWVDLHVKTTESTETVINRAGIDTSQRLVTTYITVLQSRDVMDKVAQQMKQEKGKLSGTELSAALTMGSLNNTEIFRITAVTNDPDLSFDVCETIERIVPGILEEFVGGKVNILTRAHMNVKPVGPNMTKNAVLGGITGFFLTAILSVLFHLLDNTVKGEEDIRDRFDLPVLGEIPRIDKLKIASAENDVN